MKLKFDLQTAWLIGGVVALLMVASLVGWVLSRRPGSPGYQAAVANLNARTRAWWIMVVVFLGALLTGGIGSVVLFGLMSFLALREFITMTPTRPGVRRPPQRCRLEPQHRTRKRRDDKNPGMPGFQSAGLSQR